MIHVKCLNKAKAFAGNAAAKGVMDDMFLQQLINGLTVGATYALVTIGFTLIYSVLELTNFAHTSFYMLGAYITMTTVTMIGATTGNFLLSLLLAMAVCGGIGVFMQRTTLQVIREKNGAGISAMLCTVGVQTVINNAIILIWGSDSRYFPDIFGNLGKIYLGSAILSWVQVFILIAAIVLMAVISLIIYRTRIGRGMRAIAQNATAARLMGVNVNGIIALTFLLSTTVAAIAGTMVGSYYKAIDTNMASSVGFKAFAAAILGGMGSLPGAVVGGILIGVAETLISSYVVSPGYRDAVAFLILIIVLIIRPRGIWGQKETSKV